MPLNSGAGTASGITGPLAIGSRGPDVRTLQEALNRTTPSPGLQPDGAFGLKTDSAVRAFQRSKGLKADGIVGPLTAKALGLRYTAGAVPRLPAPGPLPPQPPRGPNEVPVIPGPPASTAIAQLVEAVIQGLTEVQNGAIRIVLAAEDLPAVVANEIRSLLSGPFQAAIGALRAAVREALANVAAAGSIISAAVRTAIQRVNSALDAVLGVLSRLPDLLGLSGITSKIRAIIAKLQRAVEAILDLILRTLSGIGSSVSQAASAIVAILRDAAAV